MRHLSASVLLLLTSTIAFAQKQSLNLTIPSMPSPTFHCPVGVTASRNSPVVMAYAQHPAQEGQSASLHVHLSGRGNLPIEKLEITVYGTDPKGGVLPAGSRSVDRVKKTFEIHRQPDTTNLTDFDVEMTQVGTIRWADLTSITYIDDTKWNAPTPSICRAVPSPFMLVSSR